MIWPLKNWALLAVILFIAALGVPAAEALVPSQISLSGVRTNSSGGAEKGFTHTNVNFTIFDSPTNGRIIDTRLITVNTNNNGFWFVNYSTAGFDTDTDLWLSINNTSPRIFLGPAPYSRQYAKLNQTNTFNSTLTLDKNAGISGQAGLLLNSTSGLNASALLFGTVPSGALSGIVQTSVANTFTAVQTLNPIAVIGNITLGGNLTHSVGGLLINNTGGINASAIGFGIIPSGVLSGIVQTSVANTFTAVQTLNPIAVIGNITLGGNLTHSVSGLLINNTGSINASAMGFGIVSASLLPVTLAYTSAAQTWNAVQTLNPIAVIGNITLGGNLTHSVGGLLINNTGGINASAIGFGSIPLGVLGNLFSTANTFTRNQTINGSLTIQGNEQNLFRVMNASYTTSSGGNVLSATVNSQPYTVNIGDSLTPVTLYAANVQIANTTGLFANALIGGTGPVPDNVLNQSIINNQSSYWNGSATLIRDTFIQEGIGATVVGGGTQSGQVVLGKQYTSNVTYVVVVSQNGGNNAAGVIKFNGSTFNVTIPGGGGTFDWYTIGY